MGSGSRSTLAADKLTLGILGAAAFLIALFYGFLWVWSGGDTPGMRAQFICHWQFAEIAQPGKTSWNLEPWRPVVDDAEMLASGCNPGGGREPF